VADPSSPTEPAHQWRSFLSALGGQLGLALLFGLAVGAGSFAVEEWSWGIANGLRVGDPLPFPWGVVHGWAATGLMLGLVVGGGFVLYEALGRRGSASLEVLRALALAVSLASALGLLGSGEHVARLFEALPWKSNGYTPAATTVASLALALFAFRSVARSSPSRSDGALG